MTLKKTSIALATALIVLGNLLLACGPKDVDPTAKVDAPGYYNGPMQPKGAKPGASEGTNGSQSNGASTE